MRSRIIDAAHQELANRLVLVHERTLIGDSMNYAVNTSAIRSVTLISDDARVLTAQGDPAGLGQTFKDLANSTPASPIVAAKRLRDEKIEGIVHQVVVVTFSWTLVDSVTNNPYRMTSTVTIKFPKKYTTNQNIASMASAVWTLLGSNGVAGASANALSGVFHSQLERAMLGALD